MDDTFEIITHYQGKEISFEAKLLQYGFSHKIEVVVYDQKVLFEPDEERNYRAVVDAPQENGRHKELEKDLLKAIVDTIESIVK